jgi:hypothetical protein
MNYFDGSAYIGQWKGNVPNGTGTLIGKIGKIYSGIWLEGNLSGKSRGWWLSQEVSAAKENATSDDSRIHYSDGSSYIGDLKKGVRHGVGVIIFSSGSRYTGNWKNNKRHGFGKYVYCNDVEGVKTEIGFYEGNWKDNKPSGAGAFVWISGAKYSGNWVSGVMQGIGSYFAPDGSKYDGEWHDNLPHGEGVLGYSNGDKYSGSWIFGWKSSGTMNYADGQIYTGPWQGDERLYPTMGGGFDRPPLLEFEIEEIPSFLDSSFLRRLSPKGSI